ncbi:MAG: hypothetical protein RR942_14115 [Romboutsia sp.]
MKKKVDNTIEFKKKDHTECTSDRKYPLNDKNLSDSSKVITYSKHRKKNKLKIFKIDKQIDKQINKFNKFEDTHPFFKKNKPIIILFILVLIISFMSSINNRALKNSYGYNNKYIISNSISNIVYKNGINFTSNGIFNKI